VTTPYTVKFREYAEAIWELEDEGIEPIQARIAAWLGVSRASVSEMIHRMAGAGLVETDPVLRLTAEGRHLAEVVVRRHRLAERFLADVLHLPWAKVHAEAEVWETTISDDVEAAMWAVMERPTTCPHGNPIPGAGYRPPPMEQVTAMEPGEVRRIERISEELELDAGLLRFLDEAGVRPDRLLELLAGSPEQGFTVRVAGGEVVLDPFVAARLFVEVGESGTSE